MKIETKEIRVKEAAIIAKVTTATIINWIKAYGIGYKVAGTWRVDRKKLEQLLGGELEKE